MITIYISESTSEAFGCSDSELQDIDQGASLRELDRQTLAAVWAAYPDAEIELTEGRTRMISSDGMEDEDGTQTILEIAGTVYESWTWLRDSQGNPVPA